MVSAPPSFTVTSDAVLLGSGGGFQYVIADGRPATSDPDPLAGGQAFPSADPHAVWARSTDYQGTVTFRLADPRTNTPLNQTIDLPPSLTDPGYGTLTPDGAGFVLVRTVGGVYDLRPGAIQLVTHGAVLTAGPSGYVVYECGESARCAAAAVNRATGRRTPLKDFTAAGAVAAGGTQGVISSDGRFAAVLGANGAAGPPLAVVDLGTGAVTPIHFPMNGPATGDAASLFSFTPDSRALLAISGDYVRVVDPATGDVLGELPVPPLRAIAIRPVG